MAISNVYIVGIMAQDANQMIHDSLLKQLRHLIHEWNTKFKGQMHIDLDSRSKTVYKLAFSISVQNKDEKVSDPTSSHGQTTTIMH